MSKALTSNDTSRSLSRIRCLHACLNRAPLCQPKPTCRSTCLLHSPIKLINLSTAKSKLLEEQSGQSSSIRLAGKRAPGVWPTNVQWANGQNVILCPLCNGRSMINGQMFKSSSGCANYESVECCRCPMPGPNRG